MTARWVAVVVHGAVVGLLVVAFVAIGATSSPTDADIGLGLVAMPLLALGLPWTLHFVMDPAFYDHLPWPVRYAALLGPAVLNAGLHALVARLRTRA